MIFSSVLFVFLFLPIVFAFYYISKDVYKNWILFIASLVFYSCGGIKALVLMLFSILINYAMALLVEKYREKKLDKLFLIIAIIINLGVLAYYKYTNFGINIINILFKTEIKNYDIILPVGISFFTFQAMSYVIDVYRREVPAEKNLLNVGLYISFFPQLVAGPIVRYKTIAEQIKRRSTSGEQIREAAKRFIIGFSKKVILANNLAIVAEKYFSLEASSLPVISAWLGSIAFTLQIYFDFSGYSDMAIGLGKFFGFEFQENFNYPYIAKSITEFWRRWHISLSSWFRDYVYIPLGGSRCKLGRQILNLSVVWLLTGLWHGASFSFIAWGLIYLVFLLFEKFILKPEKGPAPVRFIWSILTILIVNFEWVIFNANSFMGASRYIRAMLGLYGNILYDNETIRVIHEYGFFFVIGIIFSTPLCVNIVGRLRKKINNAYLMDGLLNMILLVFFFWSISYLILGAHNPFIYFNF